MLHSFKSLKIRKSAFTMVEILAAIAIIAVLVAVMVPAIGNYVKTAKQTADRQTLVVLNDALTRYKTQGGDLSSLTVGANISNIINNLKTPVTWAGVGHQFLKDTEVFNSASLSAAGNGAHYKFTRYGDYINSDAYASEIVAAVTIADANAFSDWLGDAMVETGSSNYLALTNPNTTQLFQIDVDVFNASDKIQIWWGDGTAEEFSPSASSYTPIFKDFGSAAERTIVVVGDIDRIRSEYDDGRSDFGGDVSTMKCVRSLDFRGANTLYGNISELKSLEFFRAFGNNNISGNVSDLTDLYFLQAGGSSDLTGSVTNLTKLIYLYLQGGSNLTGDLSNLSLLYYIGLGATSTITGDVSEMSLQYLSSYTTSNLDLSSIIAVTASSTDLSFLFLGSAYPLTQSQVDTILVNMDANKEANKPRSERYIRINEANQAAPSAAGLTAKANLEAAGWEVYTN